jgi:hypothetical protein
LIEKFNPDKEPILYLTKEMDDRGDLDIDFSLPRRRRSEASSMPPRGLREP